MQAQAVGSRLSRRAFGGGLAGLGLTLGGVALLGGYVPACAGPRRVPLLGYVGVGPIEAVWAYFREGMRDIGWVEGQTYHVDLGLTPDRTQLPDIALRQVRRPVDLIVAYGTPGVQAAVQATTTIPIVMFGLQSDPVELGLVASLARPGGNVTGLTQIGPQLSGKRLEVLTAVVPGCTRVGLLTTPTNGSRAYLLRETELAANRHAVELRVLDADSPDEIVAAFDAAEHWPADGLLVAPDARLGTMMSTVIGEAARRRIPALYGTSNYIGSGALMSFGPSQAEHNRRPAYFADKILRGANPGDLPVESPTIFEFVVNVSSLGTLGVTLPPDVAAQVTEWVQ
jgi:putative tryptophan/tyrosine transport system substrate-binding protein